MQRIDYIDDSAAPEATTIVVGATAFVLDDARRLLLIRRADNGLHALPGGMHELGETMTETAVRETVEETGVAVEVTALIEIYSNPAHVVAFGNGEVRQEFSICFRARPVGGELRLSDESTDVRWIARERIPTLDIQPSHRLRIEHGYADRTTAYYT